MPRICRLDLPVTALLARHATGASYADCFATDSTSAVPLPDFIRAFYTTRLFRAERAVLALAGHPSTDLQAQALADAQSDRFAAWRVEGRADDQILLCDTTGRTRSWLMVAPRPDGQPGTRLMFGSAVLAGAAPRLGPLFTALLGPHRLYSRLLLAAAARKLARQDGAPGLTNR